MNNVKFPFGGIPLALLAVLCITTMSCFKSTVSAEPVIETPAEAWVLRQLKAGKPANLKEAPRNEVGDRRLSARFLTELLTDERLFIALHEDMAEKRVVRILHAVLPIPIVLQSTTIPHKVELLYCQFEGDVDFSQSIFEKDLSLEGSVFERNLLLYETTFKGRAQFSRVDMPAAFWLQEPGLSR